MADQQTSLVVYPLYSFEISAIGRSLVAMEEPDLSMFTPYVQDQLWRMAAEYVENIVKRNDKIAQISAAGKLLVGADEPDLSMFTPEVQNRLRREVAEYETMIEQNSKVVGMAARVMRHVHNDPVSLTGYRDMHLGAISRAFNSPVSEIKFLLAVGERRQAERCLDHISKGTVYRRGHGVTYGLSVLVEAHESLIEEPLDASEVQAISERYLLRGAHSSITSITEEFEKRDFPLKLTRSKPIMNAIVRCTESESRTLSTGETAERRIERLQKLRANSLECIRVVTTNKHSLVDLVKQCMRQGYEFVGSNLAVDLMDRYRPSRDGHLDSSLTSLARMLISAGHYSIGNRIANRLGLGFDFEEAYEQFTAYVTTPMSASKQRMDHVLEKSEQMIATLLQAPEEQLQNMAEHSTSMVMDHHTRFMKKPNRWLESLWQHLYVFACKAQEKLGNNGEAKRVGVRLCNLAKKVQSGASRNQQFQGSGRPEQSEEPPTLMEVLMGDEKYVSGAWKAYDKNGVFGIRDYTQSWVDGWDSFPEVRISDVHPVNILIRMCDQNGLNLDHGEELRYRHELKFGPMRLKLQKPEIDSRVGDARRAIAEYTFRTGEQQTGIPYQIVSDFCEGYLELPDPAMLSLGVHGGHPQDSRMFDASHILRVAEAMHEVSGVHVPEYLYRVAAAKRLGFYADESVHYALKDSPDKATSWCGSLTCYRKIGHTGLTQFIERNIGTFDERD